MTMPNCPKCREAPCQCGNMYQNYNRADRIKLAAAVLGIKETELEKLLEVCKSFNKKE